jgi:HSP20 family protein
MKLTTYRPLFPELGVLPGEVPARFQRMFEELLGPPLTERLAWIPSVNVVDTDIELLITVELPGMKKDDVELAIDEGVLTLKGEKKEEKEEKDARHRVWERTYGAFERSFAIPASVDPKKIKAEFLDGVLKVHLPKTEQAQSRLVEITEKK